MSEVTGTNLPPQEAIEFFRRKGNEVSFDWQEIYGEQHSRMFTVAKAMGTDILEDIRAEVDKAIAEGTTLRDFRRALEPKLQQKGWWGAQTLTDPLTGEEREVQLGSPRRLAIIYDTNLRTSYAAGEWERIERTKERRPYLRYVHLDNAHPRLRHKAWHGTILPVDDAWWNTHYPPNGWGCHCSVQQLSERDLERFGYSVSGGPPDAGLTRSWTNPRTGEIRQVPLGIDPGWDYHVGRSPWRGITPRELPEAGGAILGAAAGRPLPPARQASADRLLPAGLSEEEYATRFLAEFGATLGEPLVYRDVLGEPLIISDELFRDARGDWKILKKGRERSLLLLADTIKSPDEIWAAWEQHRQTGQRLLRRRYVARWQIEGEDEASLVVFEHGNDGWRGITAFRPDEVEYLERQRKGTLLWRREEE